AEPLCEPPTERFLLQWWLKYQDSFGNILRAGIGDTPAAESSNLITMLTNLPQSNCHSCDGCEAKSRQRLCGSAGLQSECDCVFVALPTGNPLSGSGDVGRTAATIVDDSFYSRLDLGRAGRCLFLFNWSGCSKSRGQGGFAAAKFQHSLCAH